MTTAVGTSNPGFPRVYNNPSVTLMYHTFIIDKVRDVATGIKETLFSLDW
jgi:hypothetical protein